MAVPTGSERSNTAPGHCRRLVLQIREDTFLREETGRRAKEYIKTIFSPRLETKRYLSLYRTLV